LHSAFSRFNECGRSYHISRDQRCFINMLGKRTQTLMRVLSSLWELYIVHIIPSALSCSSEWTSELYDYWKNIVEKFRFHNVKSSFHIPSLISPWGEIRCQDLGRNWNKHIPTFQLHKRPFQWSYINSWMTFMWSRKFFVYKFLRGSFVDMP
jgi:hypothetical protein